MKVCPFAILLFLAGISCSTPADSNKNKEEWISLFNGTDLKDWRVKIRGYEPGENFGNTFRVQDSVLKVAYDQYDSFANRFGHIFYKEKFSHYIVSAEYRFVGEQAKGGPDWAARNSGIMLHGQPVESMLKDQDFPISIEVQLLGGLGTGPRTTANVCTPGTQVVKNDTLQTAHCLGSTSRTYEGDQWVHVKVLVLGDSLIVHIVEGDTVLQYSKPQVGGGAVNGFDPVVKVDGTPLTEGYISLQSESHPVEFRNLKLLNLCGCTDRKAMNYKSYYVKSNNATCKY